MALFNYATKEITLKIVYYGPGLSGKTTNLQHLHSILNPETKGKLLSLATEADRTLFFDFLPVEIGKIRDFSIRFQLYTVPGQVRYNATRKIVLKGADAVVFVADSQREMKEQNIDSFANMRDNLFSNNINPDEIPIVFQYNKRDLKNICTVDDLNMDLNRYHGNFIEASAITGIGVEDTFKLITKLLLKHISRKHEIEIQPSQEKERTQMSDVAVRSAVPPAAHSASRASVENSFERIAGHEPEEGTRKFGISDTDSGKTMTAPEVKREKTVREEMRQSALVLPDTVAIIVGEIAKVNGVLADVKDSLSALRKEIGMLKNIKKEQEETKALLRDVLQDFKDKKERKGWFRF
jgi:signal recognition particle receptor subunit beta